MKCPDCDVELYVVMNEAMADWYMCPVCKRDFDTEELHARRDHTEHSIQK